MRKMEELIKVFHLNDGVIVKLPSGDVAIMANVKGLFRTPASGNEMSAKEAHDLIDSLDDATEGQKKYYHELITLSCHRGNVGV